MSVESRITKLESEIRDQRDEIVVLRQAVRGFQNGLTKYVEAKQIQKGLFDLSKEKK